MGPLSLKPTGVRAVLFLLAIERQLTLQTPGVRQVEDHQLVGHRGLSHGEHPGHEASPVVTRHGGRFVTGIANHGRDIADQKVVRVVVHALRFVAAVVPALVDRHDLIVLRQGLDMVAPEIPEVGKAVDHHDERTLTEGHVVDPQAIVLGIPMFDPVPHIAGLGQERSCPDEEQRDEGEDETVGATWHECLLIGSRMEDVPAQ